MAQVVCKKVLFATFKDNQILGERGADVPAESTSMQPASESRTLPQEKCSFLAKREQGFLVGFIVLNNSSASLPLPAAFLPQQ